MTTAAVRVAVRIKAQLQAHTRPLQIKPALKPITIKSVSLIIN